MPRFTVIYREQVYKDVDKINRLELVKIQQATEQKLTVNPQTYGKPLRGALGQYWRLRVGDYRIVYEIKDRRVFVLAIAHRKDIYKIMGGR